jgi:hypothetical protein
MAVRTSLSRGTAPERVARDHRILGTLSLGSHCAQQRPRCAHRAASAAAIPQPVNAPPSTGDGVLLSVFVFSATQSPHFYLVEGLGRGSGKPSLGTGGG